MFFEDEELKVEAQQDEEESEVELTQEEEQQLESGIVSGLEDIDKVLDYLESFPKKELITQTLQMEVL